MNVYEIKVENTYIFYGYANEIEIENEIVYVSDYRREKVEKLRKIQDKKLSVMSELLLIHGFDKIGILCDKPLKFIQNKYGKPSMENSDGWNFNFSHSGDMAVCAISNYIVGVDVELATRDCGVAAKKYFTKEEIELTKEYGTSYIWTRKEAVAKADGRGIGMGIDKIDTSVDIVTSGDNEYRLVTNRVGDYYISVAYR